MKIEFRSKEESNADQEQYFLALKPEERFYLFLDMMYNLRKFPTKNQQKSKDNFIIKRP